MDAGDGRLSLTVSVFDFISQNLSTLVLFIVLVIFSAYFSGAETAISASNKIKLKSESEKGNKRAKTMLRLTDNFENTLTTVLFGNNLVNIATGAVTTMLALRIGIPETVMTLCVTAIVILFGEVMPKTVVKARVDSCALGFAPSLRAVCILLAPFSAFFALFSKIVSRLFAPKNTPSVTEDDLHDIIEDIDEAGAADKDEINLLYSAFEFGDVTVGDIYTDCADVVAVNADNATPEGIISIIDKNLYSRVPVYQGSIDNILGVLRMRTFLEAYSFENDGDILKMLDPPLPVDASMPADELLKTMQRVKSHMAIVKGESGKTLGVVTIEDLLEELVGEIFDESDVVEDKFRVISDGVFEVASDISVISAFELMEFDDYDRDECGHETLLLWAENLKGGKMHRADTVNYGRLRIAAGKLRHGKPDKFYITVSPVTEKETEETK